MAANATPETAYLSCQLVMLGKILPNADGDEPDCGAHALASKHRRGISGKNTRKAHPDWQHFVTCLTPDVDGSDRPHSRWCVTW